MTDSGVPPPPRAEGASEPPPSYASADLFRGARVIVINHAGEAYRLLVTKNNRLILQN